MPRSSESAPTTSTFSMRCLCSRCSTSSLGAFSRTVTSRSRGVMTDDTGASSFSSKRRSRLVTMPTTRSPSTTGTPEMPRARVSSMTWRMVRSGVTVIGSRMTPDSYFLTRTTSRAWASMVMFLWMMPRPPSCAMVMARRASVTVSMAAEIIGMPRRMRRVSWVDKSTSRGNTLECAGTRRTSSKVSASSRIRMGPTRNEGSTTLYRPAPFAAKQPAPASETPGVAHAGADLGGRRAKGPVLVHVLQAVVGHQEDLLTGLGHPDKAAL